MNQRMLNPYKQQLLSRRCTDGSFAFKIGRAVTADSTAWAVLALSACGEKLSGLLSGCQFLADMQLQSGGVPLLREFPDACWPTPLAVMAWFGKPAFDESLKLAVNFLTETSGDHDGQMPSDISRLDSTIKGWPWIRGTFSWVEPTALGIIALRLAGYQNHPRVQEAVRMIIDRQIGSGGWNYGNKVVFRSQLLPMPESTGIALAALHGLVSSETVAKSIAYLKTKLPTIRTPHALSWGLMALAAWEKTNRTSFDWVLETLQRQADFGSYDTVALSQLLVAVHAHRGLMRLINTIQNQPVK